MSRFAPLSPQRLADRLAALLVGRHGGSRALRVGVDAPGCADLSQLIEALCEALRAAGRPVALIDSRGFYRDASLRLEYGRTDVESFYSGWLDTGALQREVLASLAGDGSYLPSLRDPVTNRSTRAEVRHLPDNGIALVTGELLLGAGLDFDVVVHAAVSRQARHRLTDAEHQWTLPALDRYDLDVDPAALADAVIRYDDPARPALLIRPARSAEPAG
ncbi:MAG: uridine kinase [Jatrophihabitans sp.]